MRKLQLTQSIKGLGEGLAERELETRLGMNEREERWAREG